MAEHKNAIKHHRQSLRARTRNRAHLSRMRTAVKRLRQTLAAGDAATARSLLSATHAVIDRSAKLGVIHANLAARTKSRLARAVAKAGA